mgnify:CR=1 FL=1
MKKKVEPDPTHCFDGFEQKLKNKEKIMTQPKRKKRPLHVKMDNKFI